MSACLTGCGEEAAIGADRFCEECWALWCESPEARRSEMEPTPEAADVAVMDFDNRVRAERQSGRPT